MAGETSEDASEPALDHGDGHQGSAQLLFVGLGAICETAARLTGSDGAAVAVLTAIGAVRELVYATDSLAQQIDEMQFTLGEGPCLDAYLEERAVSCPQLHDASNRQRWPGFVDSVSELGVAAVFAFPVPGRNRPMGVLELYRRNSGDMGERERHSAEVCAVALQAALESNWRELLGRSSSAEAAVEAVAVAGATHTPEDPFTRSQVHVAAGMIAVQLSVPTSEGLDRMRAYAYAQRQSIVAVAADVVARRLSFRDLDSADS